MTVNNLRFQELVETKRANLAKEQENVRRNDAAIKRDEADRIYTLGKENRERISLPFNILSSMINAGGSALGGLGKVGSSFR